MTSLTNLMVYYTFDDSFSCSAPAEFLTIPSIEDEAKDLSGSSPELIAFPEILISPF